jgi:hypothetical protein
VTHRFGYVRRTFVTRLGGAAAALALAGACAAPRSSLPAADRAALARERQLQQELAFEVQQDRRQRLADLAWPLRRDGAALCGDQVTAGFGFSFDSSGRYEPGERAAIRSALGVGPLPSGRAVEQRTRGAGRPRGTEAIEAEGRMLPVEAETA